jgi:hypothetical protein
MIPVNEIEFLACDHTYARLADFWSPIQTSGQG